MSAGVHKTEAIAFECAHEVITGLNAILTDQIAKETSKEHPDAERLAALRADGPGVSEIRSEHHSLKDGLTKAQRERIDGHAAMKQLDVNAAALLRQSGYANHTDAELDRAAYWRGTHEKVAKFAGQTPNLAKYDALMADRQTLRQLSEVEDLADWRMPAASKQQDMDEGCSL